jgi:hypothetical protein
MHARQEIRQCLIEIKMARWCRIATWYPLDRSCLPSRARKNFWRLIKAYPETAQRLGYTAASVYKR